MPHAQNSNDGPSVGELIVIIGGGVVGAATGSALRGLGNRITLVETAAERREELVASGFDCRETLTLGVEPSIILIAVPTPATADGYDLGSLAVVLDDIGAALATSPARHLVAVRSTVPPRTIVDLVVPTIEHRSGLTAGEGFAVASAPEFLRQASAEIDAAEPWMTVIASHDRWARELLCALFSPLGGEMRVFEDPTVAETIKLVHNSLNAAKISFFNEVASLCGAIGVESTAVAETVVRSAEAARNRDYGTSGGRPFKGACLPKDLDGFIAYAQSLDLDVPLLEAVRTVNGRAGR